MQRNGQGHVESQADKTMGLQRREGFLEEGLPWALLMGGQVWVRQRKEGKGIPCRVKPESGGLWWGEAVWLQGRAYEGGHQTREGGLVTENMEGGDSGRNATHPRE